MIATQSYLGGTGYQPVRAGNLPAAPCLACVLDCGGNPEGFRGAPLFVPRPARRRHSTNLTITKIVQSLFPLPAGEGQGEGELTNSKSNLRVSAPLVFYGKSGPSSPAQAPSSMVKRRQAWSSMVGKKKIPLSFPANLKGFRGKSNQSDKNQNQIKPKKWRQSAAGLCACCTPNQGYASGCQRMPGFRKFKIQKPELKIP